MVISGVCDFVCVCVCVCVSVCVCVRTLKEKRLELSTPNLVLHIPYSSRLACIKPGDQKIKSQVHTVTKTVTVAWLLVAAVAVVL